MSEPERLRDSRALLYAGDCLDVLRGLGANIVDAVVTDPPYHLTADKNGGSGPASLNERSPAGRARVTTGFMGKAWDGGDLAFRVDLWRELLRVVRPGGYVLSFGGTRTYHRMACAIEDAGFTIRDQLAWVYGSGFPKSLDVSKAIDQQLGATRKVVGRKHVTNAAQGEGLGHGALIGGEVKAGFIDVTEAATPQARAWDGWGTALKPAWEPIVLAQKPLLDDNVAKNVLRWGNGALNIDGCRIGTTKDVPASPARLANGNALSGSVDGSLRKCIGNEDGFNPNVGRWPANLIHDGSEEVLAGFPETSSGALTAEQQVKGGFAGTVNCYGKAKRGGSSEYEASSGSASRFFYCAKAAKSERQGSKHPTVKPLALMRYLVRLVTPPQGLVLDCFAGSGTTGEAALNEQMRAILIERETEYLGDIRSRIARAALNCEENKSIVPPNVQRRSTARRRSAARLEEPDDY